MTGFLRRHDSPFAEITFKAAPPNSEEKAKSGRAKRKRIKSTQKNKLNKS